MCPFYDDRPGQPDVSPSTVDRLFSVGELGAPRAPAQRVAEVQIQHINRALGQREPPDPDEATAPEQNPSWGIELLGSHGQGVWAGRAIWKDHNGNGPGRIDLSPLIKERWLQLYNAMHSLFTSHPLIVLTEMGEKVGLSDFTICLTNSNSSNRNVSNNLALWLQQFSWETGGSHGYNSQVVNNDPRPAVPPCDGICLGSQGDLSFVERFLPLVLNRELKWNTIVLVFSGTRWGTWRHDISTKDILDKLKSAAPGLIGRSMTDQQTHQTQSAAAWVVGKGTEYISEYMGDDAGVQANDVVCENLVIACRTLRKLPSQQQQQRGAAKRRRSAAADSDEEKN